MSRKKLKNNSEPINAGFIHNTESLRLENSLSSTPRGASGFFPTCCWGELLPGSPAQAGAFPPETAPQYLSTEGRSRGSQELRPPNLWWQSRSKVQLEKPILELGSQPRQGPPLPQQNSNQIKTSGLCLNIDPSGRPRWGWSGPSRALNALGASHTPVPSSHSMINIKNHPEGTHQWDTDVFFHSERLWGWTLSCCTSFGVESVNSRGGFSTWFCSNNLSHWPVLLLIWAFKWVLIRKK